MLPIYTITIFLSAALLFVLQPMFARMVLPLLGGSPAVWNTALVFYQATLLAGYGYAHVTTKWLGPRRQAAMHIGLLLAPLLALPIVVPNGWTPPTEQNPIPWLLALLVVTVGLPFFVVSTTSPLLQRWFATTGHSAAADPYFLYAASNVGSLLGLLGYPMLIEPLLRVRQQSWLWTGGYVLLAVLVTICALLLGKSLSVESAKASPAPPEPEAAPPPPTLRRRARWVLLSFTPSSLMLGVTSHLSTEIAAVPLLWVIPLAIYLLTFSLVFARKALVPRRLIVRAVPFAVLPLVMTMSVQATGPIVLLMVLPLLALFVLAMACHGQLADDRPPVRFLTEFYLWMSLGGVLGGVFNALVAPVVFASSVEYSLTLVLACLLVPAQNDRGQAGRARWTDIAWGAMVGLITWGAILGVQSGRRTADPLGIGLVFGLPALMCFSFRRRSLRFAAGVGAILLASRFYLGARGKVIHVERSFFGIHRVTVDSESRFHRLMHGSTLHGMQSLDPARAREPTSYYHRHGPFGDVFAARGITQFQRVAVIGLGSGAIACYAEPNQGWTFFELDPHVERIARAPRYFTFLRDCPAPVNVVLGDARLSLAAADGQYDLMIQDAYNSDAIPIHLITREALQLYLARLAPRGILIFHITNRHLDLEPVVSRLAHDSGLVCLLSRETDVSEADLQQGRQPSTLAVMARQAEDLGSLLASPRWRPARAPDSARVWTDDFSSLFSVMKWR